MTRDDFRARLQALLDPHPRLLMLYSGISPVSSIVRATIDFGVRWGETNEKILAVTLCAVAEHADVLFRKLEQQTAEQPPAPIALSLRCRSCGAEQ